MSFRVVESASALNRFTTQYTTEVQEDHPVKLFLFKVKQIITNVLRDNSYEGQERWTPELFLTVVKQIVINFL